MNVDSVKLVYFSPTRTTKQVVEGIASGIQAGKIVHVDLTPPESEAQVFEEVHGELAIIGAPVYGGRIPMDAAKRLRRLKGGGALAVVVVVYGNRAYEDALLELKDLVEEAGFVPVAGGAFLGEHSFSTDAIPIARARPDTRDLGKAAAFGMSIWTKITDIYSLDKVSSLCVPGNYPYKAGGERLRIPPIVQEALCARCGKCVSVCPNAAVVADSTGMTDVNRCISCCACVKSCPVNARVMNDPRIARSREWLSRNCGERKEPELFM